MKKTAFLLGLLFVALCSCSDTGEFGIEEAEVSDVGTDMDLFFLVFVFLLLILF